MRAFNINFKFLFFIFFAITTIATAQKGLLNNTKLSAGQGDCYTDVIGVDNPTPPCNAFQLVANNTSCSFALTKIGKHVNAVNGTVIQQEDIPIFCPGGSRFCCAQLVKYTPPTPVPPCFQQMTIGTVTGYFKITDIYCKSLLRE